MKSTKENFIEPTQQMFSALEPMDIGRTCLEARFRVMRTYSEFVVETIRAAVEQDSELHRLTEQSLAQRSMQNCLSKRGKGKDKKPSKVGRNQKTSSPGSQNIDNCSSRSARDFDHSQPSFSIPQTSQPTAKRKHSAVQVRSEDRSNHLRRKGLDRGQP